MGQMFAQLQAIHFQAFSRDVVFEQPDVARIVQQYRMTLTNKQGQAKTISSVDHFLMKRHGSWPFTKWLFYQGFDGKPKTQASGDAPNVGATSAPADATEPGVTE
jgi:hypothetical protein